MLRTVLAALIAVALLWLLPGCAPARVAEPALPMSRFAITFGTCGVGSQTTCLGMSPLTVTVTIAALAGASIACARVRYSLNGLVSTDEPDCAPDERADGGVMTRRFVLGRGTHILAVQVEEPGRRAIRAFREVLVS